MRFTTCMLSAMLLMASVARAEPQKVTAAILVQRLADDDMELRKRAKARLIELESDAIEALVKATCGDPAPDRDLVKATLSILAHWEEKSWTDPACEAAIDKFVELVRDPKNCTREHLPLSPEANYPFAEAVRVLDIAPGKAAEYLRAKEGIKISQSQSLSNKTIYRSVRLSRDWVRESKDWLYIANLAREIQGASHISKRNNRIMVTITGPLAGDTFVECIKFFRKAKSSPIWFQVDASIPRDAMLLLRSYPLLIALTGSEWSNEITDEDWAECISAWPDMRSLILSDTAGPKAIDAAANMEHVISLLFRSATVTESDLEPLRNHETLQVLYVMDSKTSELTFYINQKDTGKWQLDEE